MSVDTLHESAADRVGPPSVEADPPPQAALLLGRIAADVDPDAVGGLMRHSRRRSEAAGIGGAVLCDGERLAYGVEGEPRALDDWIDGLRDDPRHVDLRVLWRGPLGRRAFDGPWRVGWAGAEALDRLDAAASAAPGDGVRRFVDAVDASDAW